MLSISRCGGILACLFLALLTGATSFAQDWKTATTLPGVNFSGLTPKQKAATLKVLRENPCSCGCGMAMAQCRVEDPSCSYSIGLANIVAQAIKKGNTPQQALQAANSSHYGVNRPNLEEPVTVPIAGSPVTGPSNAAVTIVEFSDFQCPYCIQAVPELDALLKVYPKQVKLIFKQFPLEIHSDAFRAATAALAAQKQGKFWEMHNALFEHHNDLSMESIMHIAERLKLDTDRLRHDMESKEIHDIIDRDVKDGTTAGVEGTPTIFINGQRYNGRIELSFLRGLVADELKKGNSKQRAALR